METMIVGVIRDLMWFIFGGWVFGLVNALWECIYWFISMIPSVLESDLVNTMLEYSTLIAASIFTILLAITGIQFMINEEMQIFKRLKMIFIAGILVMGIPLIFGGLFNITNAAIQDLPTIFGQEASSCNNEENVNGEIDYDCEIGLGDTIANMFIEVNPELKAYDAVAGTTYYEDELAKTNGDPFGKEFEDNIDGGTYTCTVEECYELNNTVPTEDVENHDWFGNEETFVYVADNLIMGTITAIAVGVGLGVVIFKLFDLLLGLIITVFAAPIKFIFFASTSTEQFAKKYVMSVVKTFLSFFLYIFSIYLCSIGMVVVNEAIASSSLDGLSKILMQVLSMLAFVFGGMMNGSSKFVELFDVDTGVKSAFTAYVVGSATKQVGKSVGAASSKANSHTPWGKEAARKKAANSPITKAQMADVLYGSDSSGNAESNDPWKDNNSQAEEKTNTNGFPNVEAGNDISSTGTNGNINEEDLNSNGGEVTEEVPGANADASIVTGNAEVSGENGVEEVPGINTDASVVTNGVGVAMANGVEVNEEVPGANTDASTVTNGVDISGQKGVGVPSSSGANITNAVGVETTGSSGANITNAEGGETTGSSGANSNGENIKITKTRVQNQESSTIVKKDTTDVNQNSTGQVVTEKERVKNEVPIEKGINPRQDGKKPKLKINNTRRKDKK